MSEYVTMTATREIYGYHNPIRTLRRELTRLAKIVPPTATIAFEKVKLDSGAWVTRIVAKWNLYV